MVEHFAPEKISAVSGAVVTEFAVEIVREQTSQAQVPVHAEAGTQLQEAAVANDTVTLSGVKSPAPIQIVDTPALDLRVPEAVKIENDENTVAKLAVIAPDIKTSLQIETFRDVATPPLITPIVMESVKPDMVAPTTPSATPEKISIKPVSIDVVMPSAPKFIATPTPAPIPERGVVPTNERRLEPKIHTVIQRPAAPVVPTPSPVLPSNPVPVQPVDVKPPALPHPAPKPDTLPKPVLPIDVKVDVPPRGEPNPKLPATSKPDEPVVPQRPPEFDRKEAHRPDDKAFKPVEDAPRKPDENRYDPAPEPMPKPAPVHDDRKWDLPTPVVPVVPVVPDTPINIYTQPDITPKIPDDIGGGGADTKPKRTGCGPTCGACGKCFNESAMDDAVEKAKKFGEEYRLRNASRPGNDIR